MTRQMERLLQLDALLRSEQRQVSATLAAVLEVSDRTIRTAPYIREWRWHSAQELEEHADGALILRFVARGLNEVKRWVLYYGKGAIVREPLELVEPL